MAVENFSHILLKPDHFNCFNNLSTSNFATLHNEKSVSKTLKPIGVFWDIENVQVPHHKSTIAIVEAIRKNFLQNYREAEFIVVCDSHKEKQEIVNDLNKVQVTVVHITCTSKNAADDKLRQCMRRFTDNIDQQCAVMLISSDVNFSLDLSDFKNRKKIHVILLHNVLVSETLLLCSNENFIFEDLLDEVACSTQDPKVLGVFLVDVLNLPLFVPRVLVRQRIEQIFENCGGKLIHQRGSIGVIKFFSFEAAQRALLRMEGEDVFGSKISLQYSGRQYNLGQLPVSDKSFVENSKEMIGTPSKSHFTPFPPPPNPALVAPPRLMDCRTRCSNEDNTGKINLDPLIANELGEQQYVNDIFRRAAVDADGPNRWDYYRTPSEYLIEKTPQGHRRIRGTHKSHDSPNASKTYKEQDKLENRAAYLPFSFPSAETFQSTNALSKGASYTTNSSLSFTCSNQSSVPSPSIPIISSIDLHVTNLDQSIGAKEMKNLLTSVFKQHVMVLNVTVHLQSDGHLAAIVRVPSVQDAQYCVSQLHRRKLGSKRIMIAYDMNGSSSGSGRNTPTPVQIRAQVNALLTDIPQRRLPLFKFRELYEQRYTTSISLADLHRLRDILYVTDDVHGRCVVFLQQGGTHQPQAQQQNQCKGEQNIRDLGSTRGNPEPELSVSEMPRCPLHDSIPSGITHGWAEPDPLPELPLVSINLHQLSLHIHCLLQSHGGTIALASVPRCYDAEIGALEVSEDKGVPLEHLISCVKGVGIVSVAGHKRLQWAGKNEQQDAEPLHSLNPSLLPQMSLLCRELVDLLKMAPQCRIPFSKFIPAYHHHFGRQCRVADYGYTRLIDLLESLFHVVQILGEGARRYVTLSHRAQVKRFTSDLLRILKAQASKQITMSQFPILYEKTLCRQFDPRDYGLCHLSDLLVQVAEASVVVMASSEGEDIISLPKREQTFEEMERTKQFALEVIELLKHAPQCKLDFAKFIPAYHHHFGRQCRVADYGCTKLVELFETIPETVQVFEMDNEIEKYVQLTTKQRLKILADQVATLVRNHSGQRALLLNSIPDTFRIHFGFSLKPEQYEAESLEELIGKLRSHVQVVNSDRGLEISLVDQNALSQAKYNIIRLLYPIPDGSMLLSEFLQQYQDFYGHDCPLSFLREQIDDVILVDCAESHLEPLIRFTPLQLFSRQVHVLLNENGGRVPLANFETFYNERFGSSCRPSNYGHSSILSLLQAIPQLVVIRGKGTKRMLMVNKEMADLVPPMLPLVLKPSAIDMKPPAHWLVSPSKSEKMPDKVDLNRNGIYEDLKQFFNNNSSSVVYAPVPSFLPSMPWSPIWGMSVGLPVGLQSAYNAPNSTYISNWNSSAASVANYCNYWVTTWPTQCSFPLPVASSLPSNCSPLKASLEEIEDSPLGIPPPASLLPRPSLVMNSRANEDKLVKNPVKSRIAAQFRNPVLKPRVG